MVCQINLRIACCGFFQSKNDYSLFLNKSESHIIIAAIYVDDIILTRTDVDAIEALKTHLHNVFSIKDLGRLHYFLGMEVSYIHQGIIMTQKKFSKELLQSSFLDLSKIAKTPLPIHVNLLDDSREYYRDHMLFT